MRTKHITAVAIGLALAAGLASPVAANAATAHQHIQSRGMHTPSVTSDKPDDAASPIRLTAGTTFVPGASTTLTGTATPGHELFVSVPGADIATSVTVDDDGTWSVPLGTLRGSSYDDNVAFDQDDMAQNVVFTLTSAG
ncbi:hypothetical protein [Curtobacterium sp. VKM Ac-2922]|uniref:hypothetical protein n=1 Tax=Curtobacterium sp. VKM Ac-2922 TaxID=2929475 RepID=UPI001FB4CA83|nr:hypothetical protein [Curtobacterium sp. VKM Ac-2922]MCJ1715072.1 hypothetical protein [Curtobacterium sp. VKM Ac-2922]